MTRVKKGGWAALPEVGNAALARSGSWGMMGRTGRLDRLH